MGQTRTWSSIFSFGNEKLMISEHFDKLCEEDIYPDHVFLQPF